VLIIRYKLKCTLYKASNGKGYRIYISRNSVGKVIEIVLPYLTLSMYYKVGIVNNGNIKKGVKVLQGNFSVSSFFFIYIN